MAAAGLIVLDVVGLRFPDGTAFLCEVATHHGGLEYGTGYGGTATRIAKQYDRQEAYAADRLQVLSPHRFMFWGRRVPKGPLSEPLGRIDGLELVVNAEYTAAVEKLRALARATARGTGNPFFPCLQILEHLRQ